MIPLSKLAFPYVQKVLARLGELPKLAILARLVVFYLIVGVILSGLGADLVSSFGVFGFLGIQATTIHLALFTVWPAVLYYLSPDYALLTFFALVGAAAYAVHLRERCDSSERDRLALEETAAILRLDLESYTALPGFSGPSSTPPDVLDLAAQVPAAACHVDETSSGT